MSTKITLPSGNFITVPVEGLTIEEVRENLQPLYPDLAGAVGTMDDEGNITFARPVGGTKG